MGLRGLVDTGDEGEGLSLLGLTLVAISKHDYAAAEETGRQALEVFRGHDHRWGVTTALLVLARIANNRRSGTLQRLLQESAPLVTSGNDLWGRGAHPHSAGLRGLPRPRPRPCEGPPLNRLSPRCRAG